MACLLRMCHVQPTTPKARGKLAGSLGRQSTYAVLTFIVWIIVFPKEATVGAEMLIEIGLSGLGFARIGKQYHAVPIC